MFEEEKIENHCSCFQTIRLVAGAEEPFVKRTSNFKVKQVRAHEESKNHVLALACAKNSCIEITGKEGANSMRMLIQALSDRIHIFIKLLPTSHYIAKEGLALKKNCECVQLVVSIFFC